MCTEGAAAVSPVSWFGMYIEDMLARYVNDMSRGRGKGVVQPLQHSQDVMSQATEQS